MKKYTLLMAVALLVGATACKSNKPVEIVPAAPVAADSKEILQKTIGNNSVAMMPKAIIYRMSGDYANNVPVTLNAQATALVTYPAPTDITPYSTPIQLADGYWLDRRGVGPNTFFTKYTYQEYSKLKEVPTRQQLMESVMPGAYVTTIVQLPMTTSAAVSDTALCNKLIRDNLPGCRVVWTVPTLECLSFSFCAAGGGL